METRHNPPMETPAALRKCRYGFLTLANYSLIAVTNALEPLRMANRLVNREVYEWLIVTPDGVPATASGGLSLAPTIALERLGHVDILFVCGGTRPCATPCPLRC